MCISDIGIIFNMIGSIIVFGFLIAAIRQTIREWHQQEKDNKRHGCK